MSANTIPLKRITTRGWRMGFRNMLVKESGRWWKTRRWLVQTIIYLLVASGFTAMVMMQIPAAQRAVEQVNDVGSVIFLLFASWAPTIGACIMMQDQIIGEKQDGTAAWVLSKPLSRSSFVLAKLVSNVFGFLVIAVILQGIVGYLVFATVGSGAYPVANFAAAMLIVWVFLTFFLTFTLMLGTLFPGRGPVIGLPLMTLFLYQPILAILPQLQNIMPWYLAMPLASAQSTEQMSLAMYALDGRPLPTLLPIFCTIGFSVLFTIVAILRFQRDEF